MAWLAKETRPDLSAPRSLNQQGKTMAKLIESNRLLKYAKETSGFHLTIRATPSDRMIQVREADAPGGNAEGNKSQGGFLDMIAGKSALTATGGKSHSWSGSRVPLVTKPLPLHAEC